MMHFIFFYSFFFGCNWFLCLCYKLVYNQWAGLCEIFIWIFINTGIFYYLAPAEKTIDEIGISHMDIALTSEQPTFIGDLAENNWKLSLESLNLNNLIPIILLLWVFIWQSTNPSQKILFSHFLIFLDTSFANYYIGSNTWEINLSKIIFSIFMMIFTFNYFLRKYDASVEKNENQIILGFIFNTAWLCITIFTRSNHFLSIETYEWFMPATMKMFEEVLVNFFSLIFVLCLMWITQSILDELEINLYISESRVFWRRELSNILMDDLWNIFWLIFISLIMFSIHWGLEKIYFSPLILTEGFIMIFSWILSYFWYDGDVDNPNKLYSNIAAIYLDICAFRWILSFTA
ncbi:unnamed protein product [Blepharisma stoltei]|uniref:Uncharacterized protein n=1 Tax=Blepharisma stoltei TaxID=1481888 RepID=A0AAU9IV04_9CILI|nr:unnamed protein product [Blepharisma stoltei]